MTISKQQVFFNAVELKYFGQPVEWCSGYTHGVQVGLSSPGKVPPKMYTAAVGWGVDGRKDDPYAAGFIRGFVDAYGPDAAKCQVVQECSDNNAEITMQYRWWEELE